MWPNNTIYTNCMHGSQLEVVKTLNGYETFILIYFESM